MAKHYSVDDKAKVITADILALTAKEEAEVEKLVKFGYTVENKPIVKTTVARLNDPYILDYLKDDNDALATYNATKNEPATDDNGKVKTTTKGKTKTRGFNAGRNWFARNYPEDINVAKKAITEAGLAKTLDKSFEEYEKKNKGVKDAMDKDAYTRDFYWKKVFERA